MKLSPRAWAVQWELHGWIGVIFAVPLFIAFYCGVFALFHDELVVWQEPLLQVAGGPPSPAELEQLAEALIATGVVPPDADVGFELPHEIRHVRVSIGDETLGWVEPQAGGLVRPRSELADALYGLHFLRPLPLVGMELSGVAAIAALIAAIGGLLLLLGRFRRNLWRYRPQLRRRWWAADAHKSLGLLALPFVIAMAWSGATLSLGNLIGAGLAATSFDGSMSAVQTVRGYGGAPEARSAVAAPAMSIAELVGRAQASVGTSEPPHYVGLVLRGDADAWVFVFFESRLSAPWRYVFVRARDGEVLLDTSHARTPTRTLEEPLYALHFAWFGGDAARCCYVVLTLAVCVLIVLGQVVWVDRRPAASSGRGLVARVGVGACAGLVLAVAVYFALNRRLPDHVDARASTEWWGFIATWILAMSLAMVTRARLATVAAVDLAIAGALDLAVAMGDALTLPVAALALPAVTRIELLLVALGLASAAAAWLAHRAGRTR